MKLHRFIIDADLTKTSVMLNDKFIMDQIRRVLRLKIGGELILGDGHGNEALAEISELKKEVIKFQIIKCYKNQNEPHVSVALYCSILKRENFEWVVQKATEVGVTKIVPIITERTVKIGLQSERLQKIIKEAAEQSSRGIVPKISDMQTFEEAVESAKNNQFNLFFDPSGENISKKDLWPAESIGVWIGPEGGWTDKEISEAKNNNFKIITLGKLTLRAETAAVVASYITTHSRI